MTTRNASTLFVPLDGRQDLGTHIPEHLVREHLLALAARLGEPQLRAAEDPETYAAPPKKRAGGRSQGTATGGGA